MRVPLARVLSAFAICRTHLAPILAHPASTRVIAWCRFRARALRAVLAALRVRMKLQAWARPETRLRVPDTGSVDGRTARTAKCDARCQVRSLHFADCR